ncbi:hypothetical protein G6F70_002849 [Rhizopus microsporus]|uniref:Phosphatidylinositol 4-kinase n=1 Tax=Rhizopus microsporus TaxID=58291 RepID=A0A1X0RXD3_RHIZD|nr:hypothetical protein G6F71_002783 [Rhizopus microsporus]KAG1201799.1 hypothetical protein G6F70_002849 [Rhizopus microsporus]KAG1207839.1 hypothetical protein G6F69_007716 [Rhizopus microsporus]KAG1228809.1 hypothetical protein G6F67_007582 [Rhizopus microsporus]KAG1260809.1 hypothetical protein G6F68_007155 [Rhizopus microsporus]
MPQRTPRNAAYTPLHEDEEDENTILLLVHHPNSVLVANHHGECHVVPHLSQNLQPTPHSPTKSSFSEATRRFFQSKLPIVLRKDMAITAASFASLPPVIIADLQNGNMPTTTNVNELGWAIVRRKRYRGKNGVGETRHHHQTKSPTPSLFDVVDEEIDPSDQVTCSIFVKWEKTEGTDTMTMSPLLNELTKQNKKEDRHFKDPIPVTSEKFLEIVQSVRIAIENNMQPTRISQGSSGSYFCRNMDGKIVGVFKPKNEEPYGRLNPKWTKWIHRHLFPCFFGRSCLIPNLGYISEAAASLMDRKLGTNIVPYTDVIHLSSSSFHYDYLDRRANRRPPKIGSFQCFLTNYKDATVFFKSHPFGIEKAISSRGSTSSLIGGRAVWGGCLGATDEVQDDDEADDEGEHSDSTRKNSKQGEGQFRWSMQLQNQFRREFEQLVILDYLIRNTDRGLDNWMIKYCPGKKKKKGSKHSSYSSLHENEDGDEQGHIHVAAIDNGLAFPYKHPDQWRSYPYGWIAMPDSLVNRPFSEATRNQFLPILSDPLWWRETVREMRSLFELDDDFDEKMFQKQVAVLKGQGFNIIRALKDPSSGPIDLVAMERIVVNQEEIVIEFNEKILQSRCEFGKNKRSNSLDAISNIDTRTTPIERDQTWKQKVKSRLSIDIGRSGSFFNKKRKSHDRAFDSDGDFSEDEEEVVLKKVTVIMETIELVKSRTYFTCW